MYWYDKPTEAAIEEMTVHVERLRVISPYLYALMDPSMEHRRVNAVAEKLSNPVIRLYEGFYDGDGLERVDPYLVRIHDRDEIALLSESLAGVPALSFIGTVLDPESMKEHLRNLLEARSADGKVFLLRWADTRALRAIRDVFYEEQWARVMAGLSSWWSFDRNGAPICFSNDSNASDGGGSASKLQLNQDQMKRFEAAMAADLMLGFIRDHSHVYGYFAQEISHAQCHAIADELVGIASLQRSPQDGHDASELEKVYSAMRSRGWLL